MPHIYFVVSFYVCQIKHEIISLWETANAHFVNKCSTSRTSLLLEEDPLELYKVVIGTQ
jgi:hypothetical protein